MAEACCGQRHENCRACGGDLGREYHFAMGSCYCLPCWREIARAQRKKDAQTQRTPSLAQARKPGEVPNG